MGSLKWTVSHAVYVPEIDDQHQTIFEALAQLEQALSAARPLPEIRERTDRLLTLAVEHFAHEERLMRAARYDSMRWHRKQHDAVRKRGAALVPKIALGDAEAGHEFIDFLKSWLSSHTSVADRMMGAFLRNHQLSKLTIRVGTKPADACEWVGSRGDKFDPTA
jgi:hemerythrin